MLESVAETFESAASRSNVDADEMFMQLLEKVDSPLGHVWLDGVSVSAAAFLPGSQLTTQFADTSPNNLVYRLSIVHPHL